MKISIGKLRHLVNEAVLREDNDPWIASDVEMTPAVKNAIKAFRRANAAGDAWYRFEVKRRRGSTVVSTYIEGYVKKVVRGRVSVMPSVGGDYNIPYRETPDQEIEERVFVTLLVQLNDDGTTVIEFDEPRSGKRTFNGRGFGKKAEQVVADAANTFRQWRKRFEEE